MVSWATDSPIDRRITMEVAPLDIAIISLLLIIWAVGIATRSSRVPYPVALVLAGLLLGTLLRSPLPFVDGFEFDVIHLTPHLILVLFLPALLFEAALHIEGATLRKSLLPIGLLAIPGVLLTAAIVGALVYWGVGLDWPTALLFGAIVAATDPIAVLAIFQRTGAPHDLAMLVEGESLFNDGTAVVLSRILIGVVLTGAFDIAGGVLDFALVVGGGPGARQYWHPARHVADNAPGIADVLGVYRISAEFGNLFANRAGD